MQTLGSQRLFQIAVKERPELLLRALRRSGAVGRREKLRWTSPLAQDAFKEYRDAAALKRLGIASSLTVPLQDFWPRLGQVWDGLAVAGEGRPILVEAKAHIPETVSRGSRASEASLRLIERSLKRTRKHLATRSPARWNGPFYQYANRLAFQFFLRELNDIPSSLVFFYFTNAVDMDGPSTEKEWRGAIGLTHAALGLPADLEHFGVYEAFLDARQLTDQT